MADGDDSSTGKPATSLRRLRWIAEIAAVRTVVALVRLLPPRARLRVGHGLGRFAWAVDTRHRQVARANLAAAFPERPAAWRRQVERDCYRYLGRLLVDVATQCHDLAGLSAGTEIEGWEHAEAAARLGRGFFLVSGHFGLWERAPLLQAARGLPVLMVARPLDNPYLERWLADLRRCTGNTVVYKRQAARAMVRGLARGACVGYMVDQNFPLPGAVFPTFFGRPAAAAPTLGQLAVRYRVPVVPAFAFPRADGTCLIRYSPPIFPRGDGEDEGRAILQQVTDQLEAAIREMPHAWFWVHRRWRTQPPGGSPGA
jgi:KDO2-lipid IV(A) lauroyltransferase